MNTVLAHGGIATPDDVWSLEPSAVVALAAAMAVLGGVVHRVRRRPDAAGDRRRLTAFCGGAVVIVVAIFSPLHALADALFAAHMVQHLLLVTVAAPLLVRGAPSVLGARRPTDAMPLWTLPAASAVLVVVFTMWHAPGLYQAALGGPGVHGLEHASMLGAALWYWAAIGAAVSRGHDLAAVGAIAVSGLAGVALGALLALSPEPWYPAHDVGAGAWDVDPLADQQLGGMIMWIPGGTANLAAAVLLVFRFLSRPHPPPNPRPRIDRSPVR